MYADDLILISTTKIGIKKQLIIVENYCTQFGIKYNPEKTEYCIFNRTLKRPREELKREPT